MDAHLICQQFLKDAELFPGHPMQPFGPRKIHFWAKEMARDKNKVGLGYKNEVIYISIVGKDLLHSFIYVANKWTQLGIATSFFSD